jgi:HK97 family phage major capsid protein
LDKRQLIADLLAQRAAKREGLDAVLAKAQAEARGLTEAEQTAFDADEAEIRSLDTQASELDAQIQQDAITAELRKKYAPSGVSITSEPEVYRKNGGESYFRDIYHATREGRRDAVERLVRNDRMRAAEERAISTTNGGGGEFVPPLWLENDFIKLARPGRITADLTPKFMLPAGTDVINIPKINTGTAVAPQATQNTGINQQDLTTTSVASSVVTIAGGQTISLQLLEQSPLSIDTIVLADLAADYAVKLNTQVVSGAGTGGTMTGITTVSGTNQVTYTNASPSLGTLYSKIADAIQRIHTSRYLPPDSIIMHPRRWAWCLAQLDGNSRPLIVPDAGGPFNRLGAQDGTPSQGFVGTMGGLPVYVDATIATNLGAGTNQDAIIVARMADLMLWEGNVRAEAFQQTYAQNMSVLIRLYNYASFQPGRYPQSISVINGTGLVAPTF